jgi:hypothetical protein
MPHMITLPITLPCPSWKNSRAIETGTSNRKRPKHPEVPVSRIRLSSMPLPVFRLSSPSQSSRLRHHVERAFARQRQISELGNRHIHARIQTVNDPTNRGLPYLLPGSGQTGFTKKTLTYFTRNSEGGSLVFVQCFVDDSNATTLANLSKVYNNNGCGGFGPNSF